MYSLFPHQEASLAKMWSVFTEGKSGFFENSVMGAGKTRIIYAFFMQVLQSLQDQQQSDCCMLVIAPLAVHPHWGEESRKMGLELPVVVYQGVKRKFKETIHRPCVVITSLDTLRADYKAKRNSVLKFPYFKIVAIDEAHKFANIEHKHKQNPNEIPLYKSVFEALKQRTFTIISTGTPLQNSESDIDSLCTLAQIKLSHQERSSLNAKADLYASYSYRATPQDICKSLPPVEYQVRVLEYASKQIEERGMDLLAEFHLWNNRLQRYLKNNRPVPPYVKHAYNAARCRSRLYDVSHCSSVEEIGKVNFIQYKNRKFDYVIDFILKNQDKKIVITSEFTSVLHLLGQYLSNANVQFTTYDGTCTAKKREEALRQFREEINVLLLAKKAGGCGLNLYGDIMILLEPYINHAVDSQVVSRIMRLGQTHKVLIICLLFPLMDTIIWNLKKEKLAKASLFVTDEKHTLETIYECSEEKIKELLQKVQEKATQDSIKEETKTEKNKKRKRQEVKDVEIITRTVTTTVTKKEVIIGKTVKKKKKSKRKTISIKTKTKSISLVPIPNVIHKPKLNQKDLWYCQNQNCSSRVNLKPVLVCKHCNTPKGKHIELFVVKLKRKQ